MAQTVILATANTAGTSTDVVVPAGSYVTLGAYVASGQLPMGSWMQVYQDTPGSDNCIGYLGLGHPTVVVMGPGTYRVFRAACETAIGAFSET